ncbi:hypothetical protein C7C46_23655 [Streptomyces tateyamensis]|uniref:Uncharacterized protein n=1 Tax=Streptomyces tateyamensis TaxID=565073 RepID=A0A2V4N472_9ACTN|nr:hypothetical protein [Streptomyces tateyamensis]PYC75791.1 hypothetical protein C7C46_23655 [Streptomyces tateyamensis]
MDLELILSDPNGADDAQRDMEFLREELGHLALDQIGFRPGGAPPSGTRSGDVVDYASLVIGVAGAPALKSLILLAQDWLARRNSGTIDLKVGDHELHLTSVSRSDQRRAIEAFVQAANIQSPDA